MGESPLASFCDRSYEESVERSKKVMCMDDVFTIYWSKNCNAHWVPVTRARMREKDPSEMWRQRVVG